MCDPARTHISRPIRGLGLQKRSSGLLRWLWNWLWLVVVVNVPVDGPSGAGQRTSCSSAGLIIELKLRVISMNDGLWCGRNVSQSIVI
jgi:hypothetical protein